MERGYIRVPLLSSKYALSSKCQLNSKDTVVFYFPGFSESPSNPFSKIHELSRAFLEKGNILPIVVNYENLVGDNENEDSRLELLLIDYENYRTALINRNKISLYVADVFAKLFATGELKLSKVRLIGLSLGAQIISKVSKNIKKMTGLKFPRITGLDPAGPLFYSPSKHLTKDDAVFVDVIHTNAGVFGFALPMGHADFYVNFPLMAQPGCPTITKELYEKNFTFCYCSHDRSFEYFVESVQYPNSFPACQVDMAHHWKSCDIVQDIIFMGYDLNPKASGLYHVVTNSKPPFGKGPLTYSFF